MDEIAILKKALNLACGMLILREPGDCRAVSDEFVALAAVECGDYSAAVIECLDKGVIRLAAMTDEQRDAARGNVSVEITYD